MPADTSKAAAAAAAARRRNNLRRDAEDIKYDSSHAREIELKRSRGEISCAECRRCDHRVLSPPCLRFTLVRSPPQAQGRSTSFSPRTPVFSLPSRAHLPSRFVATRPSLANHVRCVLPAPRPLGHIRAPPHSPAASRMCCSLSKWSVSSFSCGAISAQANRSEGSLATGQGTRYVTSRIPLFFRKRIRTTLLGSCSPPPSTSTDE